MGYKLFEEAATRYDLHTPPDHYLHDHRFVLELLGDLPTGSRILDVGCGTGVFLQRALDVGLDAFGIDASERMVDIARRRVEPSRVGVCSMQALEHQAAYDGLVCLCWSFNYCRSLSEARKILVQFLSVLRPGGRMVLQVAHAANATGKLQQDRESGPTGIQDDVVFLYRFTSGVDDEPTLLIDYVYACTSLSELVFETHRLRAADVLQVAELATDTGFVEVMVYDDHRRAPLLNSVSPFLVARAPA